MRNPFLLLIIPFQVNLSIAQTSIGRIRLNQIGFYPSAEKIAIVEGETSANRFYLLTTDVEKDTVYKGILSPVASWDYSEEKVRQAHFSSFKKEGEFELFVPEVGTSYPFTIRNKVLSTTAKATLKAFYYHRASTDLPEIFAGKWTRKMGHPDTKVIVHTSASSPNRKAGSIISSPKGWYDAGDYNKYIVNSGITMYTLLSLVEDFPFYCDTLHLNIPETSNKVPDVLDEILWNLRWMFTMQDPNDGGVYHKLTNPNFDEIIMPAAAIKPRYVVKKTTSAALDFAAVMAQASRTVEKYRRALPGLADSCLKASIKAYTWAQKNSEAAYVQSDLSDPTINTGAYDDFNFKDEMMWASVELFVTTGKIEYYDNAKVDYVMEAPFSLPVWQNVSTLGLYTLAKNVEKFKDNPKYDDINLEAPRKKVLKYAQRLRMHKGESAYGIPMGTDASDFSWGSNSVCANQGMVLVQAFMMTGDKSYVDAANANLDYLLGRNATTYSFITGFGEKSTRNPHQRLSEADGVEDPLPGFMVGGPNPRQEDKGMCSGRPYPSSLPGLSYLDNKCSYASNEIAINWQAVIAYLTNAVEAIRIGNYDEWVK